VSASVNTFGEGWFFIGFNTNAGSYENFWFNPVDFDFIELMGMKIVQGRNFSRQHATDRQQAVIINEAFVKEFGLKNPVGGQLPGKFPEHSIIGVVKDFNFRSLHESVEPLVLSINPGTVFRGASDVNSASDGIPKIAVKIRGEDISGTLAALRGTWLNLFPDIPFNYSFLDERVERQYRAEERWQKIVSHSSTFAIVIACLGLFGLASLAVTRRTKEIGVRKILGATAANVMFILSKEFTVIVLIAILVAWPAAYLVMNSWLQDFAYRIDIGFEMFIFAGLFAFGIALITVSYHSIKATFTNPVDALRYE
ncbi:FtsX-like permease family protein, partial [candidate division KSB1 bacterium]|nr:FtsX-like permease family protein [candidate division KSB1 bacterium]